MTLIYRHLASSGCTVYASEEESFSSHTNVEFYVNIKYKGGRLVAEVWYAGYHEVMSNV